MLEKFNGGWILSTDSKARYRMYSFVVVIFVVGLMIAGAYLFIAKPGESEDKPVTDVVGQER